MADSVKIPLDDKLESIVKQCGPALIDVLKHKFGCEAVIHGVSAEWGSGKKPSVVPDQRFSTQLPKGMTVSVWKDDLTTHQADAVVNAANERLSHGGGLALALSDAGGPNIQRESDRYVQSKGKVFAGEAAVTTAGKLNYQKIIHAVGPCLQSSHTTHDVVRATPILKDAIKNILRLMEKENLQSVAIPAISSGLFNFPLRVCADTIVKTLSEHDQRSKGRPLEIHLVNNDEPSVKEMERACREFLPQTQQATSSAAGRHGNSPCPTLTINNVTLTIKKGSIERQKTDIIVNTIGADLNLSNGAITRSILQAAGQGIQDEINKKSKSKKHYNVIETKGYGLNCQYVYHTICPEKYWRVPYDKILADIVWECLNKAHNSQQKSICFPAIGTGLLGYDKDVVARVMMEGAVAFAQQTNGVHLDISYLMYPTDTNTYKAFEDGMRTLQVDLMRTNDHAKSSAETPHIELISATQERMSEARRWIWNDMCLHQNSFNIRNNFIQHFGQREHENLLSFQTMWNISITESFQDGCAGIQITGSNSIEVSVVGVEVEAMCCKAQEEFAREEEDALVQLLNRKVSYERSRFDNGDKGSKEFPIVRVEKLENPCLKQMFELKKQQLSATPRRMYQRLPAQFCELVSRVGFHRELAPPDEQKYGQGIYFCESPRLAMELWRNTSEDEYLYFVEAQVLTGRSTTGSPDLILPPSLPGSDPSSLYDSLTNTSKDIHVVFNGYQALPEYLFICKKRQ
ncbi:protein mono-ADP-ribosyltransferase PARP9 isoform X3 [Hypomesus transpacificus]|uniref:protein mono-ADP-ribosyltransferase PARP9 isoform X3 n=1 Tax=Hypomesus transpacificus TaxID=137520 RepID=UPI001F07A426|nr:protein mono-ADP-ribosyltransferase PARP9 isoform X3 [Hypomesus transpacificus]